MRSSTDACGGAYNYDCRPNNANQRYYSSQVGRFLTADPYVSSGGLGDPQNWNRYSYVGNDPVNFVDPSGTNRADPDQQRRYGPGLPGWLVAVYPDAEGGIGSSVTNSWGTDVSGGDDFDPGDSGRPGGATSTLVVNNLSKSGNNQTFIENTFRWIRAALADDAGLLGMAPGSGCIHRYAAGAISCSARRIPRPAYNRSLHRHEEHERARRLCRHGGDDQGAFLKGGFKVCNGTIEGGTDLAPVFILLHELAHGLEVKDFESDYGVKEAGARNDAKVLQNCQKTLDKLR